MICIRSARYGMSSERDDECLFVTRHDSKPHVLCRPMMCRTKVDLLTHCLAVFVFLSGGANFNIMNREDEKYLRITEWSAAIGWIVAIILAAILITR